MRLDDEASFSLSHEVLKPRVFPQKVDASPDVSEEVKAGLTRQLYEPRSNETDAETAARMIQERGIEEPVRYAEQAKNVKAYHRLKVQLLGGKPETVSLLMREDNNGNLYYNHHFI